MDESVHCCGWSVGELLVGGGVGPVDVIIHVFLLLLYLYDAIR